MRIEYDGSDESDWCTDCDGDVDVVILANERLHPEAVRLGNAQASEGRGLKIK